jgi:hypothetical protein
MKLTAVAPVTVVVAFLGMSAAIPRRASAQAAADKTHSVFDYCAQGFALGALTGLSAGYLFARAGGWKAGDDWRTLGYGVGIGALAGGGLGLGLGIGDLASEKPGRGYIILRDTVYGAGFGAAAGAIAGGLAVLSTKKAEHILFGAALGGLIGVPLGVVLGVIESQKMSATAQGGLQPSRWVLTVAAAPTTGGEATLLPAVAGRF